ncbi:MAG: outer membrane protein assembly factor BamA [Chthoniobacterales bacterium]
MKCFKAALGLCLLCLSIIPPLQAQKLPDDQVIDEAAPTSNKQITFQGNVFFKNRTLLAALNYYRVYPTGNFDVMDADDAAYFLQEFYYMKGFPDAVIEYHFSNDGPHVTFDIQEGERIQLGTLTFVGNTVFSSKRLHDIVEAYIRQATSRIIGKVNFVESAILDAGNAIIAQYKNHGYLGVQVWGEMTGEETSSSRGVEFIIEEGPQYILENITANGWPQNIPPVEELFHEEIKHFYQEDEYLILRSQLLRELQNAGYYKASAETTTSIDPSTGRVYLHFQVIPGPKYRIGKIIVEGYEHTMKNAVYRVLGLKTGEEFDGQKFRDGIRRLWFSGAFKEAQPTLTPRANDTLDIKLNLEEALAKQLKFGAGYGEWDKVFGEVKYTDRNFLGSLLRFEAEAFASVRRYGTQIELTDPFLFNTQLAGKTGAYFIKQRLPAYRAYMYGGFAKVERQFSSNNLTGYSASYNWRGVSHTRVYAQNEYADLAEHNYTIGSLSFTQILDRRNDMLVPMSGYKLEYNAELASRALGGEISYFKIEGKMTYYIPLREITKTRPYVPFIMINHAVGAILPFDNHRPLPVPERFFLGGPDTVRSFQYDGMAPRTPDGQLLGGNTYWVFNLETQIPLAGPLYGVLFSDVGNLSPSLNNYESKNTRIAIGLGFRFYTPIGALHVDYGYNLIRRDGDPIGAWQFGFGFSF